MSNVIVPATAKLLTGGIGYSYGNSTRPLTQIDLSAYPFPYDAAHPNAGGLMTVVPNAWKAASTSSTRRPIVANALCNECHAKLGIAPTYHAGNRNDAPTCSFCHSVNRVNSGWAVNAKDVIHAIHAAGKRTNKFSWEVSAGAKYWGVTYPGYLRNCEQCHLPGTYDFSASASSSAVPNLLWSTVATGVTPASISSIILGTETVPGTYYAPFLTAGADYGTGFSFASGTGVSTQATGPSLVISPISSACYSCHDTSAAKAHMQQNGGSIYESRTATGLGTANVRTETCLVCHGTAANTLNTTVPTIKAVHRWW
jgi:OmcA/MtrC family decaheme c-type cytochrome